MDVFLCAAFVCGGIARLLCNVAGRKFRSGELVDVLPEYAPPKTDIFVLFADRRNIAPKLRACIELIVVQFRQSAQGFAAKLDVAGRKARVS